MLRERRTCGAGCTERKSLEGKRRNLSGWRDLFQAEVVTGWGGVVWSEDKWEQGAGKSINHAVVPCRDSGRQGLPHTPTPGSAKCLSLVTSQYPVLLYVTALLHCIITVWVCVCLPQWTMHSLRTQMVPIVSESSALSQVTVTDEKLNTWWLTKRQELGTC